MKNISIFLYFIITISFSCWNKSKNPANFSTNINVAEEKEISCSDLTNHHIQEKADFLLEHCNKMNLIKNVEEKVKVERLFLCAFPSNFEEMEYMFGFYNETGKGPLYLAPNGRNVINCFKNLSSIPKYEYYDRYINICVNGVWQADNIRKGFGIGDKLKNDTEEICKQLSKKTDEEIQSVFHFIFEGPHPINDINKRIYEEISPKIGQQDERLEKLLRQTYEEMMAKDYSH